MTNSKNTKPHLTIIKHSLKILSWNIQSPCSAEGNKFLIPSFQKIINDHDFACLQEIRKEVHMTGYRSVCNTRKDNKSGGVAILIRNELIDGIEVIKNLSNSDYLICRLDKDFFKLSEDIFIINVYVKPQNSSASTVLNNGRDTLKRTEDLINDLRKNGEVVLCGDFNARIGHNTGMLELDSNEFVPLPDDYKPDNVTIRNSLDGITNTYG